jgi:hypothetical protein
MANSTFLTVSILLAPTKAERVKGNLARRRVVESEQVFRRACPEPRRREIVISSRDSDLILSGKLDSQLTPNPPTSAEGATSAAKPFRSTSRLSGPAVTVGSASLLAALIISHLSEPATEPVRGTQTVR